MIVVKDSTARGKQLIAIGSKWEGNFLHQVYDRPSIAKQQAFDRCYQMYLDSEEHDAWGICSHNTFGFTVSWICKEGLRIETPKNSYLVLFTDEL